jgi:hypothetical protein
MPELMPHHYEQDESLKPIKAEHVSYLGIFDADRFPNKIESWLPALNLDGTHLVIGDNCSSDTSLSWLMKLVESMDVRHTIIRNKKNYGGYGGFAINLHRFLETKWFTTLHQDDRYRADHVQRHREVLRANHSNLGMICSEFESVLPDGKKVAYPRAGHISVQDTRAVEVLAAIGRFSTNELNSELVRPANLGTNIVSNSGKSIWLKFFGYLPLEFRKSAFRLLMKSSFAKSRMKAWNFDWERI